MKKQSLLKEKSFHFSLECVDLCRYLKNSGAEYVLIRQLLRSGTAIGAMVREAEFAQSRSDFINKLSIGLKEANEKEYWIELLIQSSNIEDIAIRKTRQELTEIIKMLISSIKTAKGG